MMMTYGLHHLLILFIYFIISKYIVYYLQFHTFKCCIQSFFSCGSNILFGFNKY